MTLTENRWRRLVMVSTIFPMIGSILSLEMGNGTRAFAMAVEQPKKCNTLCTAEMMLEDDYDMSDVVINNGIRGEELEKAQEYAEQTPPEKPSIRERLEDTKREYSFSVRLICCTPVFFIYFRHYQAFPFPLHFLSCQRLRH